MKKAILILTLFIFPLSLFAQTIDDIGKIVIGVKILPTANAETLKNKEYLQNKLMNLASNAGFTSYGRNAFIITPSVIINDSKTAEGGMKNIYVVNGDIYLNIQDGDAGTVFASTSFSFQGTGTSKDDAIKNGIQKISFGNTKPFFDEARSGILKYFTNMQDKIFAKADMLCTNKQYDAAIACLMTIPEELIDPYKKAYSKASEIYKQRDRDKAQQIASDIKAHNNEVLVKARSIMATHDAVGTLKTLWNYRIAGTEQDNEYQQLIKTAEERITAEEQAALEKEKREYEEQKRKEERDYQDMRRREERAYADSRREYEDNLQDRRQAHNDNVNYQNRLLDLDFRRAELEREQQRDITEAIKEVALHYNNSNYEL